MMDTFTATAVFSGAFMERLKALSWTFFEFSSFHFEVPWKLRPSDQDEFWEFSLNIFIKKYYYLIWQLKDLQAKRNHVVSNLNWNMNVRIITKKMVFSIWLILYVILLKVNTLSEKIVDQAMDYCMICYLPILIYGRLIPCKHVMCIQCANSLQFQTCLK